jgi:hypothetical protein
MLSLAKKVTYFLKNDLEKLEEPTGRSIVREVVALEFVLYLWCFV